MSNLDQFLLDDLWACNAVYTFYRLMSLSKRLWQHQSLDSISNGHGVFSKPVDNVFQNEAFQQRRHGDSGKGFSGQDQHAQRRSPVTLSPTTLREFVSTVISK